MGYFGQICVRLRPGFQECRVSLPRTRRVAGRFFGESEPIKSKSRIWPFGKRRMIGLFRSLVVLRLQQRCRFGFPDRTDVKRRLVVSEFLLFFHGQFICLSRSPQLAMSGEDASP